MAAASAPGAPLPSAPGLPARNKQPRRSCEARLHARRLANWGTTHETPEGRPHLKPQVGEHLEQRLAAPPTGPKQLTRLLLDSVPGQLDRPAARNPSTKSLNPPAAHFPSKHRAAGSASCELPKPKTAGSMGCARPKHKAAGLADQRPTACQGPYLQHTQSPAGPASSLGQR